MYVQLHNVIHPIRAVTIFTVRISRDIPDWILDILHTLIITNHRWTKREAGLLLAYKSKIDIGVACCMECDQNSTGVFRRWWVCMPMEGVCSLNLWNFVTYFIMLKKFNLNCRNSIICSIRVFYCISANYMENIGIVKADGSLTHTIPTTITSYLSTATPTTTTLHD